MTMNQYGARAQDHWRVHRAAEYAQLEDPTRFFTDLGKQIAAEIDLRCSTLERTSGAGQSESFLDNLGSLNNVRHSVEGEVLREMAFTEPDALS
ncbi:hypothetical protein ACIRG5_45495 [Lentzea sp. NPDC102401]|uniref:hypothetical protein n=1 Tax=Lentzea sp. NPDC102401 TaxID=3364128 RepID=UPI0038207ACD